MADRGSAASVSRTESGPLRLAGLQRSGSNASLAASACSVAGSVLSESFISRASQQQVPPIIMQTDDELRSSIIIEPGNVTSEAASSPRASRGGMRLKRAKQVRNKSADAPDLASFSVMSEGNESIQSSRSVSRKRVTLMASPRGLSLSGLPSLLSPSVCDDDRLFRKRPAYVLQPTERLSTLLAKVKEAIEEAGQEVISSRRGSAAMSNGLSGRTSAGGPEMEHEAALSVLSTSCADLEADMMSKMDKKLDSSHPYEVYRGSRESYNMLAHSMLCLNPFNPVRTCLFDCINSRWFENTTLVVIILNSITLAMDIPATEDNDSLQDFLRATEYFFQAAFTVEMLMKAVALGVVHHPHAYLRSTWNCIDFLVVIGGFISFIGQANVSVLRLVRVVRPLRTISRVAGMRTIMNSIVMAIPSLLEVSVLISFLMITFAITGMGLFMEGWHQRCHVVSNYTEDGSSYDDDDYLPGEMWLVQTDTLPCGAGPACGPKRNGVNFTQVCTTGEFHDDVLNFDSIGSALLLVFKVIALDDWPDDMLKAQKATSFWAFVYFVVLTLTGAYFCVNLILAILSSIFSTEADAQELDAVQLGSLLFRSRGKDVAFDTAIALNPGGLNPPGAQPSGVLDPDTATKWTDLNAGDLIVQFVAPVKVDEYTFSTAKDAPQCDPVSWRLEGWCPRMATWVTQHEVDNFDTPDERTVELPLFSITRPQRYMRYRFVTTRRRLEEIEDPPLTPIDPAFFSSTGFTNDDDESSPPPPLRSATGSPTYAAGSLSGPRADPCATSTRSTASTAGSRRSRHGSAEPDGEIGSVLSGGASEKCAGVCSGFRRGAAQRLRVVRCRAAHVVRHRVFGFVMLTVTVVNSVCMSIDYYGINKDTESWLYEVNHWCSLVFAVEMVVCLGALGVKEYFGDNFYAFDFLLVVLSMPNIVMTLRDGGSKGGVGRAMSAFRVFRLARVARIAERFSGLRLLLETILKSVMSVTYLFLIMLLFIFIFGILGLQLFSNAYPDAPQRYPHDYGAAERSTFKSFPQSLLTVFVVITGESWAQIMKQGVRGTNASATIYFLLLFVLGHYVFLNLVIAILIYNFSEASGRTSDAREENERAHEFRRNQRRLSLIHRMMHSHRASIVFLMQHHSGGLLPPPLSPVSNPLIPPLRDLSTMDETQNSNYVPSETGTDDAYAFPPMVSMAPDALEQTLPGKYDLHASMSSIKGSPTMLARNMTVPALSSQRSSALRGYVRPPSGRPANYTSKRDMAEDVFGLSEGGEMAEPIPLPTALRARALSAPVRSGEFADIRTEGEKTERELDNPHLTGGTQLDAMSVLSEVMEGMQQANKGPSLQGRSFGMFGHDHFLRVQASRIVLHKYFDTAVIPVILINVVVLSADKPTTNEDSVFNQVLTYADLAVTLLFVLEALLKTFVLGVYHTTGQTEDHFVLHPELGTPIPGYLNSVWNCIDMAVCLGSVASIWIKSMKSVKSIRAVRLIILSPAVRVLFLSLFTALPQMVYVCLVCSFVWLVFGILGVQLFKGSFYYCTDLSVSEEAACLEGTFFYAPKLGWNGTELTLHERKWVRTRYHFDDIGNAVLTLFEVALGEGWVRIMYTGVDASLGHGGVALELNRHLVLSLYFVAFVIIGGFFSLNLFVGMLIEQFGQVKAEKEGTAGLNESQRVWLNVCKVMNRTKLYRVPVVRYDNPVLHGISRLVRHPQFDNFIMGMIMVNLTFMSVSHKDEQEWVTDMLHWVYAATSSPRVSTTHTPTETQSSWVCTHSRLC